MASDALVITGPTATGKTGISLEVAERLDGEIISMDSRQVYRGMDIGTAKATTAERRRVPHHGLDLVDPDERYNAGRFATDARRWIDEIRSRGRLPILVGGTGFFLRALTQPLFAEPPLPTGPRRALQDHLDGLPAADLERWLATLDPATAAELAGRAGGAGRQRLSRALEIALLTGRPLSWWHAAAPSPLPPLRPLVIVLDLPRPLLNQRIDHRVQTMIDAGLEAEVAALLAAGYHSAHPGMNATGYAELIPFLRGECSREDAIDAVQRATRRYARRQLTWFRNQLPPGARWLDASEPQDHLVERVVTAWREEAA
jgi:tRNA dimethylallyltransferase